jgi:hypothetical protein
MHDEESRTGLSLHEEDLSFSVMLRPACLGQGAEHRFAKRREEGDLAQRAHARRNVYLPVHGWEIIPHPLDATAHL